MHPAILLIMVVMLTACAQEAASPPAESEQRAAEPPSAPDPVAEARNYARQEVLPPTIVDPPVETVADSGLKMITSARGNGETAAAGDLVAVHYTGWLQDAGAADGKGNKFDSSVDRGEPLLFALGVGKVIKGWDQGLEGMREGGKRTLIIPPDLAYGTRGFPPVIPADSTLVFDVELVSVTKP